MKIFSNKCLRIFEWVTKCIQIERQRIDKYSPEQIRTAVCGSRARYAWPLHHGAKG